MLYERSAMSSLFLTSKMKVGQRVKQEVSSTPHEQDSRINLGVYVFI